MCFGLRALALRLFSLLEFVGLGCSDRYKIIDTMIAACDSYER